MVGAVDDVETAFRCALRCGGAEDIVVIADSILHLGLATLYEITRWAASAPLRVQALIDRLDLAESGLESIVRFRLRSLGASVRPQVQIGRARVDLLIGDRLIIECDGREFHSSWRASAADRARDREFVAAGYLVIRLTYHQIFGELPIVERDIMSMIRRDMHRWPRRQMCA